MQKVENLDISTPLHGAVFYSGPGKRARAVAFARKTGRKTIEDTPGGAWLDQQGLFSPSSPLTIPQAVEVWSRLSKRFASGASGEIHAFIRGAKPDRVFHSIEKPALYANPEVYKYTFHY